MPASAMPASAMPASAVPAQPRPSAPTRTARETVDGFLAATTGADPGALADFYAPQVVIEMPFAPAGLYPARTETTREELRTRFRAGAAVRAYESLGDVRVHETADPELIVAEYALTGRLLATGEPFTLPFVMFLTVRDGHIAHTRDYSDPLAGAKALGRLPALLEAAANAGKTTGTTTGTGGDDGTEGAADPAPLTPDDRAAITELLALHGHLTDSGALDRMGEVFTDDVAYDLTGLDPQYGTLRGRDALRAAALALGAGNPVGHHVTNTVLTPLPDGRVTALSKGIGVMADGAAGSVTYEDTVTRGADGWRVSHRRVRAHHAPLGGR
jgi:uncharacterized protein